MLGHLLTLFDRLSVLLPLYLELSESIVPTTHYDLLANPSFEPLYLGCIKLK